jgi:hypothetical protein
MSSDDLRKKAGMYLFMISSLTGPDDDTPMGTVLWPRNAVKRNDQRSYGDFSVHNSGVIWVENFL